MDRITILKGADRVRRRPAVIFSSDDIHGVEHAIRLLLELFSTEAKLGYCKSLTVVHNKDEVTISGDDRGIYLGEGTDDPIWQSIFCEIFAGPRTISEGAPYTFSLPDVSHATLFGEAPSRKETWFPENVGFMDICAAQYASSFMNVDVVRAGVKYRLEFKKGYYIGGLQAEHTDEHSGTIFHFAMDPEVFSEVIISDQFFVETLINYAMLSSRINMYLYQFDSRLQTGFPLSIRCVRLS